MKKINKIFNTITFFIIVMFFISVMGTYLTDYLNSIDWFGDYECMTFGSKDICYGARHKWYNATLAALFFLSMFRLVFLIVAITEDEL